jgi:ABC-type transport system involved in multi-copper enzyme maturation permease subunit
MQFQPQNLNWIAALQTWLQVVLVIALAGFVLGGLLAARARGSVVDGFSSATDCAVGLFSELVSLSMRRVWAITWHCILESLRRRMLLAVLAVFVVLFLFAGWYLPSRPTEQVRVYVSFVMMSSTLIAMVASGLLACLGLPSDIKDQTIHTVVTKPVRRLEIVAGRALGLTILASLILIVMGLISYVYLTRSVGGTIAQLQEELAAAEKRGDVQHKDRLQDDIDQIQSRRTARVPVYSESLEGPAKNVGYETTYRKYIEGNRTEAAIWHFTGLPVEQLLRSGRIPVEMTFTVFRTTKGEIGRGVLAQLTFKNPKTGYKAVQYPFEVREYYTNRRLLEGGADVNLEQLFRDSDGALDVEVRCLSPSQYLGMAHADLYMLLDEASFALNFAKGIVGVWIRVVLIICVAVMFSTFLNSYVAMFATLAVFVGSLSMPLLRDIASGTAAGGGPLEAAQRLVTQNNLQTPLEQDVWNAALQTADKGLQKVLTGLTYVLPDLRTFNTAPLVANGFNIGMRVLLVNIVMALGYVVPFILVGYFLFISREIAR